MRDNMVRRLEQIRLSQNRTKASKEAKQAPPTEPLAKGDWVLVRSKRKFSSAVPDKSVFQDRWMGPVVVHARTPTTFLVHVPNEPETIAEFHARDVKRYYGDRDSAPEAREFAWEELLEGRGPSHDREYLVRWKNYPDEFNSWVTDDEIAGGEDRKAKLDREFPPTDDGRALARAAVQRKAHEHDDDEFDGAVVVGVRNLRRGKIALVQFANGRTTSVPVSNLPAHLQDLSHVKPAPSLKPHTNDNDNSAH